MIPKKLSNIKNIFFKENINDEMYIFSYINKQNEIFDFYKDKIRFNNIDRDIYYFDISSIKMLNADKIFSEKQILIISCNINIEIYFKINTITDGKYLDIFPLHDYIKKRIAWMKL